MSQQEQANGTGDVFIPAEEVEMVLQAVVKKDGVVVFGYPKDRPLDALQVLGRFVSYLADKAGQKKVSETIAIPGPETRRLLGVQ